MTPIHFFGQLAPTSASMQKNGFQIGPARSLFREPILKFFLLRGFALAAMSLVLSNGTALGQTPTGLVRLSKIAPDIPLDIRYAGTNNFIGRPLAGYDIGDCLLQHQAASAVVEADQNLHKRGLGLVIFDCYRPVRAVHDLLSWARTSQIRRGPFNPSFDTDRLVRLGYIATRSKHSTGLALDVGLRRLDRPWSPPAKLTSDCTRLPADPVQPDMGTPFDCFDPKSGSRDLTLPAHVRQNRMTLAQAMIKAGFASYEKEWWHFTWPTATFVPPYDLPLSVAGDP